ncbi:FHA domain-containing protein [Paenibacillus thiaminolyticus]|uniref:FHA domain-containing protein n=1 Tax=Paenibacillus thiaminolyticus TaxID=49283 RepID=UPI001161E0FE|nr:FHA domain-containing protein [Paenibacillus thiaminolyticus]MDG0873378.1 FHA domain-containing protein [Paenibacillus thiaminolyticus]WCF08147.1 FHA domain-containing protein [Paenibacillus thiaminolyticus]WCR26036.1 FHA domain-containing protein [Paenibacillus thiaminolyticus]
MRYEADYEEAHPGWEHHAGWIMVIDMLIAGIAAAALFYVYIWNADLVLKVAVGVLLAAGAAVYAAWRARRRKKRRQDGAAIAKLVLLDEEGESVKEWYIHGETSLLIGKSSAQSEVDIDLSDSEYASLISKHHAVLNYASGSWYVEDLDSRNGVGIQPAGRRTAEQLEEDGPYRIESGDIICIANTRIVVK